MIFLRLFILKFDEYVIFSGMCFNYIILFGLYKNGNVEFVCKFVVIFYLLLMQSVKIVVLFFVILNNIGVLVKVEKF